MEEMGARGKREKLGDRHRSASDISMISCLVRYANRTTVFLISVDFKVLPLLIRKNMPFP